MPPTAPLAPALRPLGALAGPALLVTTLLALGCGAETSASGASTNADGGVVDANSGDALAVADSASPPDGGGSAETGAAASACPGLLDDFSGGTLDLARWRTVGFMGWTPEVVGGRLSLTPVAGYTNTRTGVVQSKAPFTLEECAVSVEVVRALPATTSGELNVALNGSGAFMRASFGRLQLVLTIAGKATESFVPWDPVAHRWWRFRESAGVIHLETSPDGANWTERAKGPHEARLEALQLGLNVITTAKGELEAPLFDNVNAAP